MPPGAGARIIRTFPAVLVALVTMIAAVSGSAFSQTLARPGWVGSGLTAETWFKHAIFYEIDTGTFASSKPEPGARGDLRGIIQRLDYIHSLSIDAILLKPLSPAGQPTTVDPAFGTLDDLDDLTLQASRLKIRIILEVPAPDPVSARFWLTRGIAGFYIPGTFAATPAAIEAIRKLLPAFVGQRVLITDADHPVGRSSPNDLLLDRYNLQSATNPAPGLRTALENAQTLLHSGTPILAIGGQANAGPYLARTLATTALLNRSAALVSAGQELGFLPSSGSTALLPLGPISPITPPEEPTEAEAPKPPAPVARSPDQYTAYVPYVKPSAPRNTAPVLDPTTAAGQDPNPSSLLNFYRELGRLHHGMTALRDGEEITFNHDDLNTLIWIRKPAAPSQLNPPVLVACNLSAQPVVLSLKPDVTHLQLRGTFLRTILRSDDLMGGVSLDPITLPPFGVYVGSLRY